MFLGLVFQQKFYHVGESLTRNEEGGNTGSEVRHVGVSASRTGASSYDPSCFDPLLPRIKDDGDPVAFIAKLELELSLGDVLELGFFGIPIGIPFGNHEYNPGYSPVREGSRRVPFKRKIFVMDGRMREVMITVDTIKLVEDRSPFLEHQVCYDITRAMVGMSKWLSSSEGHVHIANGLEGDMTCAQQEIDSLHGQISSLDDAHESTKDELLKIKNDGDLVAFITKYQDAFLEDVIIYLGGEESSSVPCSREGSVPPLAGFTKKHATQGSDDPKGKKISTKRVPQPSVAPRLPTGVVNHEPKPNPFTLLSDSTLVSPWPRTGDWHSSSSSKGFHSLLCNLKAALSVVKLFWTPVDMVKLAKVRSPSLEHQVCYDFTKATVGMYEWLSHFKGRANIVMVYKGI
ncbi:hypothetical protein F0562_034338 [Nyssa sinensis]|uniref:Uncharacterized protein n=1 Tax=Nyssa sinensis TaxID=561372 RepID=A0A5J5AFG0_9ASTE|nr:hypothetical protein F0562_034338 [Nyssa sinensis]